jgi:hypothetical protein
MPALRLISRAGVSLEVATFGFDAEPLLPPLTPSPLAINGCINLAGSLPAAADGLTAETEQLAKRLALAESMAGVGEPAMRSVENVLRTSSAMRNLA